MIPELTIDDTEVAILGRIMEVETGDLSPEVAQSWLRLRLPEADEKRLRELSGKASQGQLGPEEAALLEN